ncbi:hypothetical protein B0H13DRAFT_2528531 [Mycena leptocephala]|nr:hypothetical protein B0H13DRAFT_2528531 [Mycena leptocephala]
MCLHWDPSRRRTDSDAIIASNTVLVPASGPAAAQAFAVARNLATGPRKARGSGDAEPDFRFAFALVLGYRLRYLLLVFCLPRRACARNLRPEKRQKIGTTRKQPQPVLITINVYVNVKSRKREICVRASTDKELRTRKQPRRIHKWKERLITRQEVRPDRWAEGALLAQTATHGACLRSSAPQPRAVAGWRRKKARYTRVGQARDRGASKPKCSPVSRGWGWGE